MIIESIVESEIMYTEGITNTAGNSKLFLKYLNQECNQDWGCFFQ